MVVSALLRLALNLALLLLGNGRGRHLAWLLLMYLLLRGTRGIALWGDSAELLLVLVLVLVLLLLWRCGGGECGGGDSLDIGSARVR